MPALEEVVQGATDEAGRVSLAAVQSDDRPLPVPEGNWATWLCAGARRWLCQAKTRINFRASKARAMGNSAASWKMAALMLAATLSWRGAPAYDIHISPPWLYRVPAQRQSGIFSATQ